MTIEFHVEDSADVNKWLIEYLKKRLKRFGEDDNGVTGASVYFYMSPAAMYGDHTCVIVLADSGHSIMVQRSAGSYVMAAGEVMDELTNVRRDQGKRVSVLSRES